MAGEISGVTNKGKVGGDIYVGGIAGWNTAVINNSSNEGKVTGNENVGGVAGKNYYEISDVTNSGKVNGSIGVGGIVGLNGATISGVTNSGAVEGYSNVGGIAGSNEVILDEEGRVLSIGIISNAKNTETATVTATGSDNVGGIAGWNTAVIYNSSNEGDVTGKENVGGITGINYNKISYVTNSGKVNGDSSVGGLVGLNGGTISGVTNSGAVEGSSSVGGIAGSNEVILDEEGGALSIGTITNCYYDSTVYSGEPVGENINGIVDTNVKGKTTAQFKSGEVCYLLNGSKSTNPVWYQLLETETYPNLDSTNSANRTVYQSEPCTGVYSNDENKSVKHTIAVETVDDVKKHKCTVCGDIHEIVFTANDTTDTISVCCDLGTVTLKAPTENLTYDGTPKAAAVTGGIEGFTTPDIVYNTDDGSVPVSAGTYTASITYAIGENEYSVSVEYTIEKANITPTVEVTGSYSYTGSAITPTFTVKDGATALKPTDYTATITDNINAGTATITTAKKSGGNYDFDETNQTFTIGKATAPTVEETKVYYGAGETGTKTIKLVLPAVGTIDYENSTVSISSNDNGVIASVDSISADGIKFTLGENGSNADKTATITATLVTQNYENITAKLVVTINEKETPAAPTCELGFTESNGTYTATITAVEGAEYSFDGTTWSSANTKENIAPNTVVTAYIRIKATTNTNESPVTTVTATTPALKAAKPTITASTTFTSSQTVTIGCTTEDSEIYYTIDGTAPTASTGIKYNAPFTVTATTTVKAIAVKNGYDNSDVVSATYTKKTSSGSSGGSSGGSSSTTTNPSIGGSEKSWSDIAADLGKLTTGSEATIVLNGNTKIPANVIKAIEETKAVITFKINTAFSWTVDGSTLKESDIKDYNFQIKLITASGTETLRGTVGTGFTIDSVTNKATLNINFKTTHSGKFANLFKKVDGKLVFADNVMVDENGAAIGLEVSEKGEYVVMLGKFSDRPGDMNNDGILNPKDSFAVLNDFVGLENGVNPLVSDINDDGYINPKDALAILKKFLGIE